MCCHYPNNNRSPNTQKAEHMVGGADRTHAALLQTLLNAFGMNVVDDICTWLSVVQPQLNTIELLHDTIAHARSYETGLYLLKHRHTVVVRALRAVTNLLVGGLGCVLDSGVASALVHHKRLHGESAAADDYVHAQAEDGTANDIVETRALLRVCRTV